MQGKSSEEDGGGGPSAGNTDTCRRWHVPGTGELGGASAASTSWAEGSAYAKAGKHLVHSRKGEGQFWSKKIEGTLGAAPRDKAGLGRTSGGMAEVFDFIPGCHRRQWMWAHEQVCILSRVLWLLNREGIVGLGDRAGRAARS